MAESVVYTWTLDGAQPGTPGADAFDLVPLDPVGPGTSLRHLVIVSLFTDARADETQLPSASGDPPYRGGWWGDTYSGEAAGSAAVPSDRFGSLLWTLYRGRATAENVEKAKRYAETALQWMIDDGLAERVEVAAERIERSAGPPYIGIETKLYRGTATRYAELWADEGVV